jgi:hypothetical protein
VSVNLEGGSVTTSGLKSYGVLAQSVGGGGGAGGLALSGTFSLGNGSAAATVGGSGASGGTGSTVKVTSAATITTGGAGAHGIFAQSVGGGGGAGGFAGSATLETSESNAISAAVGGVGGSGNTAGAVSVKLTGGSVRTTGTGANAVFAQSVGGNGGDGGFAFTGVLTGAKNSGNVSASVGGVGGVGGIGGAVTVDNNAVLSTSGYQSHGVFAQSVGGGGGTGGLAVAGAWNPSGGGKQMSLTVGGGGGTGGASGAVTVTNKGQITVAGGSSSGVFAQSVGGSGGAGGMAFSGSISGEKGLNSAIAIGGDGARGGMSAQVNVTNTGSIIALGDSGVGIYAQSVGGGGGTGGASGSLTMAKSSSWNASVNVGGKGGAGNIGNEVHVTNSGSISTAGDFSEGIVAQSVGGGGGHGGMAGISTSQLTDYLGGGGQAIGFGGDTINLTASVGGNGGTGAFGAWVEVVNSGSITTKGSFSHGIRAQSLGGGGGDAGIAVAVAAAMAASRGASMSIGVGGSGGVAGDGSAVDVTNNGSILTDGDGSHGIYAQSVGGGGGDGGMAKGVAEVLTFKPTGKDEGPNEQFVSSVSLGGKGGAAGDGGTVVVTNTGSITTNGSQSYGIFAESVGGGGGAGGSIGGKGSEYLKLANLMRVAKSGSKAKSMAVNIGGTGGGGGSGGAVTVSNTRSIKTTGYGAHAIYAMSTGGGGGDGGNGSVGLVNLGGAGAVTGDGGEVKVTNSGSIVAEGTMARGIYATSVGGGGGAGGNTSTISDSTHLDLAGFLNSAEKVKAAGDFLYSFYSPNYGVSIGGKGGAAGNGGKVTIENSGSITTSGLNGHAIFAESIGGGGGVGGEGVIMDVSHLVFSGDGGSAGNGGAINVTNTGTILTNGFAAFGIFAQSVGGGGGVAGDYSLGIASVADLPGLEAQRADQILTVAGSGSAGSGGNGGDISVTNTGSIIVRSAGSVGIFLQSVGGGGGLFGGSVTLAYAGALGLKGTSGKVTLTQTGDVSATGVNATAIFLQSDARDGQGDITATINGAINGGSGMGAGIRVSGGANNRIDLKGSVMAESGLALQTGEGNETVNNGGKVYGNVELGSGTNRFNNLAGSEFYSGPTVNIGSGGILTNNGILSPGGKGTPATTTITGSLVQTSSGATFFDIGIKADKLVVTGSASLAGTLQIGVLGNIDPRAGTYSVPLVQASGGVTINTPLLNAPNSSVMKFQLKPIANNTLTLGYTIDYSPFSASNAQFKNIGDFVANLVALTYGTKSSAPAAQASLATPEVIKGEITSPGTGQTSALTDPPVLTDEEVTAIVEIIEAILATLDDKTLAVLYNSFSPQVYAGNIAATARSINSFGSDAMSCSTGGGAPSAGAGDCMWMRATGRRLTTEGQYDAFNEDAVGLAGGRQWALGGKANVGFALGLENARMTVDTYARTKGWRAEAGVFGKLDLGVVDAQAALSGGYGWYETERSMFWNLAKAESDQQMVFGDLTLRLGRTYGTDKGWVRPNLDLSMSVVQADGSVESGGSGLDLRIYDRTEVVERLAPSLAFGKGWVIGGADVSTYMKVGYTSFGRGASPSVRAGLTGLPAGTLDFTVRQTMDQDYTDVEAGIGWKSPGGATVRFDYAGTFGDRTKGQTAGIKVLLPF